MLLSPSERRLSLETGGKVMLGEMFDPKTDFSIHEHCRPHWSQAGAVVFITFRTADSIPREVLERWEREKREWLIGNGIESNEHWSKVVPTLKPELQNKFKQTFNRHREDFLDTCQGECVLQRNELAQVVHDSLLHFDGDRYRMGDFIVMPNHVHLLCTFLSKEALVTQCDSWLHFTARQINLKLGRKGKLWQQEPFDHLVRSPKQYEYLRKYIADNGVKAGLQDGQFLYRRYKG
jgi:type I restriction enzyme R subunit